MPAHAVLIIRERSSGGDQLASSAVYTGKKPADPTPFRKRNMMNDQCEALRPRSNAKGCCARLVNVATEINASITRFGP